MENNPVLNDPEYVQSIEEKISQVKRPNSIEKRTLNINIPPNLLVLVTSYFSKQLSLKSEQLTETNILSENDN